MLINKACAIALSMLLTLSVASPAFGWGQTGHRVTGAIAEEIRQWATIDVMVWIKESTEIRDTFYPKNANNINYDYLYVNLPTAKTRLQMAGIRIALYLNAVFEAANK